jgi:hypothetical protein
MQLLCLAQDKYALHHHLGCLGDTCHLGTMHSISRKQNWGTETGRLIQACLRRLEGARPVELGGATFILVLHGLRRCVSKVHVLIAGGALPVRSHASHICLGLHPSLSTIHSDGCHFVFNISRGENAQGAVWLAPE